MKIVEPKLYKNNRPVTSKSSLISLLPFVLFLLLFLGTGTYLTIKDVDYAFYQLPASIAIIPAIFLAIYLGKDSIDKQIGQFVSGAGNSNIITMCLIYLLAGAFAVVAKASGSVDASVQLGLSLFPEQFILPGLFLVAAFLATAMGTSMGTIAAISPIALGIINSSNLDAGLVAGCLISGAIFGDNLSIISDTTIASTRSQGAKMRDKFKTNIVFALPAALLCLIIYLFATQTSTHITSTEHNFYSLVPYLTILVLALLGVNVFIVLFIGITLAAAIAMLLNDYLFSSFIADINKGFASMQDIFILSLFIGGLSQLISQQGGLLSLTNKIKTFSHQLGRGNKTRSAGIGIAGLAFITNFFTANNTVSIIVCGETAKKLADDASLAPARSASLLDVFSCINQGLIPYGAQALLVGATLSISPVDVVFHAYYPMILLVAVSIWFWRASKKPSN